MSVGQKLLWVLLCTLFGVTGGGVTTHLTTNTHHAERITALEVQMHEAGPRLERIERKLDAIIEHERSKR